MLEAVENALRLKDDRSTQPLRFAKSVNYESLSPENCCAKIVAISDSRQRGTGGGPARTLAGFEARVGQAEWV